ncbi:MAG: LuxR C-terminal-related transcriptional regulator [Treponema sp.]|nr:LuxR C-terminal-related transcriptional regulator [Treponema sp.]
MARFLLTGGLSLSDEPFVLERKRIHCLLEKAAGNSVVLVTAGAGYGKTRAVDSFLRWKHKTAVWLSLTERDNDPLYFWESVTKTVTLHDCRAGKGLEEIGFPESPSQIFRCLSVLADTVARGKRFAIVADNFHLINGKPILDFVNGLLTSPYPKETMILISRMEPDINVMSLFSKGILSRVTVDDLRFNEEEIAAYFRLRNISLTPDDVKNIFADTEGWALAIRLIAEEIKNGKPYSRCLLAGGSVRSMIDTLFASVPVSYQRFLVTVSFFDQWPAEVLSKILPPPEEQIIYLNHLSALYHYDVYLHCFRIHPLFLEYLREKQGEVSRQEIKNACSIYAQWCMENRLLAGAAISYGMTGDYKGLMNAIYSSPRIMSRPAAASFMEILERVFSDDGRDEDDENFLFLRHVTRAGLLFNLGRYNESKADLEKSIRKFEDMPPGLLRFWILSACYNTLGTLSLFTYRITRDISPAVEYFQRGNYYRMCNPYVVSGPMAKTSVGSYANILGHSPRDGEFEQYIDIIARCIPHASHSIGGYLGGADSLCRAELEYFKGELNAAEQHAREAVFKAREKKQYEIENKSLFYLLRIYLCSGDVDAGRETYAQMEALLDLPDYINRYLIYDITLGWIYAHTGMTERIAPWLKNDYEESDLNLQYQNYETMTKAKSLLAEKRYAQMLSFTERKEAREGLGSYYLGMLELTVLRMAAHSRMGDEQGALKILEAAYGMAQYNSGGGEADCPVVFDMPFIELGEDMRNVANMALNAAATVGTSAVPVTWLEAIRGKASVYAKKLSAAADQYRGGGEEEEAPFFTSRELAVLKGISRGLTREKIAAESSLSVSSVKNIIKAVYGKLGAINRADAIRIATALGLLK